MGEAVLNTRSSFDACRCECTSPKWGGRTSQHAAPRPYTHVSYSCNASMASVNLWPCAVKIADEDVNDTECEDPNAGLPNKSFWELQHTQSQSTESILDALCLCWIMLCKGRDLSTNGRNELESVSTSISPQHNQSVALALDRTAGHVSPQFHIKCDPCFHTTKDDCLDSWWQIKAGFVAQREVQKSVPARKKRRAETSGPMQEADLHGTEPSDAELMHTVTQILEPTTQLQSQRELQR